MKEGGSAGAPEILRVPLRVRHNAGRGNRAHPARRALPCVYGLRVINTNCFISFDDSSAALRYLPLQTAKCQIFVYAPLPNISPKILYTPSTLTRLDPRAHRLEFIPCCRRLMISVSSKKVRAVVQDTHIGVIRNGYDGVTHGIARKNCRVFRRKLGGKVRLQIHQILAEHSGPDHVNTHQIWPSAAFFELLAPQGKLIQRSVRPGQPFDQNSGFLGEVLQVSRQSRKPIRSVPFNIEKRQGNGGRRRPLRTGWGQTQEGYNEDRGKTFRAVPARQKP